MFSFLNNRDKWNKIRTDERYKPLIKMLDDAYKADCENQQIDYIPFSIWMSFANTGERLSFENLYFKRRRQLSIYTILSMLYPDNESYLISLQDVICAICEEYSWCLPAHLPTERLNSPCHIDLFAAETGLYMAEIKHMLSDRLSSLVIERMTYEIDRRIVKSIQYNSYFFESCKSNWGAVCGGSVAITLMYEAPDVYVKIKPRIENCIRNYLESVGEDGSVSEGTGYWEYGFCFYTLYADMLKRYTNNKKDIMNDEKIKKLSFFYSDMCLSNNTVFSFADSDIVQTFDIFTLYYHNNKFGVGIPPLKYGKIAFNRLSASVRAFLYFNPETENTGILNGKAHYNDLQCYIERKEKYAFAVKGGHNAEEHNHNDVASFVVVSNDKQLLCDLGAPVYSAYAFSDESYETVVQKASWGHNVPIIGGKSQGLGRNYFGELSVDENKISIDFRAAYPVEISKLIRNFELTENEIILEDEYDANFSFAERFVSEIEPQIENGCITIDCMKILFEEMEFVAEYSLCETKHHNGDDRIVYLITVTPKKQNGVARFSFVFDESIGRN